MASENALIELQNVWAELRNEILEGIEGRLSLLDTILRNVRPSHVVVAVILGTLILDFLVRSFIRSWLELTERGFRNVVFGWIRSLPFVQSMVDKEKRKMVAQVSASARAALPDEIPVIAIPEKGMTPGSVLAKLKDRESKNVKVAQGSSTVSGTVYFSGEEHEDLLNKVYTMFAKTNPLHADVFPSVRLIEAEVIEMTASILGKQGDDRICGAMTGGGTESILSAVKASRDYMARINGITDPHMIIAESAHAAYWKAAEYFKIKLTVVKVDRAYQLSPKAVKKNLRENTILVVASAPGYPHGIMDPIQEIAKITKNQGVLLHVDACLGGFVLPFAKMLGRNIPPFDFYVSGVTSMSVDTHKYGMGHKGTSVVLYRHAALRRCQYTSISDWTGGLYISPGMPGSRSGALISTAWASLLHLGLNGYKMHTENILNAAEKFKTAVKTRIPELEIVGNPIGSVVAFKSARKWLNIFKVHDLMQQKGWHLNTLQFPAALHMCFTARHKDVVDPLIKDLLSCVKSLEKNPNCVKNGSASIYGTACSVPDRTIVRDLLEAYQDAMLKP